MREPLLIPLAAFSAGILLCESVAFSARETALAAVAFAGLAALARVRKSKWLAMVSMILAVTAAGAFIDAGRRPGPAPEIDAGPREVVILSGCVVQPPVFTEDRERLTLELEPGARVNVSLALRDGQPPPRLAYGQRIEIDAKARRPRNFENPGGFDYVHYLARQDVHWTASARADAPIRALPGRCGSRLLGWVFALRVGALERLESLYAGDSYATGMMEAILLGESSKLERIWTEHFRRTGTYHALVISGLHVAALAGVLLFLLRICMLAEMPSLAIAASAAWAYAAVSGWSAPVIRAAGGFTLYLVCRYFYRRGRILNLVAAIALGYLAWDPGQLFDASFQLSFLSVAAIGAFAVPILDRTSRIFHEAPRRLAEVRGDARLPPKAAQLRVEMRLLAETAALWTRIPERFLRPVFTVPLRFALWAFEMVVISAVVQIALALPMALYFHRVSITGLSANLLIVPLMAAVVPAGFLAIFTGWGLVAWAARAFLVAAEWIANWHIQFEPTRRIPDPPFWVALALVAALVAFAIGLRSRRAWVWGAFALVAASFAVMIIAPFPPDIAPGRLEMTAIDVGQGDSLLLNMPAGKTMLVDGGGIPQFGRRAKIRIDIGEDVVSPYLWSRRIQRVDAIAITHVHTDHVGGIAALIENFRPRELWTGAVTESPEWEAIQAAARRAGTRVIARRAGEQFDYGGARIEVLAPLPDYVPGPKPSNNDSLVFRANFGERSFLLTGDMEWPIESRLVDDGMLRKTTALKVAHHGSKTSTLNPFLDLTQPVVSIISAGEGNLYGNPSPGVLDRLAQHHSMVLRTDLEGLISVSTDGRKWSVRTMRSERRRMPPF